MKKKTVPQSPKFGFEQLKKELKEMMPAYSFEQFKQEIKTFWKKQPVFFSGLLILAVIFICWFISSLEIFPEGGGQEPTPVQKGFVLEKGDGLIWIGMEVTPVSRTIRKDFKVPGNIKGMFVVNEGKELAQKYGVKTGDVILTINRKQVRTGAEFLKLANNIQYSDGILLEIWRDGNTFYLTIPFEYQYGPLFGPNKGGWQMGSPVVGQGAQYGPIFK